MLRVGDKAPEIDAIDTAGEHFVLSQQSGLCTVLYFFPKAFTHHCTLEAETFRDNYAEIILAGATLLGVSTDKRDTQCRFSQTLKTPFPMIPDEDHRIAESFGVLWPLVGLSKRVTYIIGKDQIIEAVFDYQFDVKHHRNDVLRFINDKFTAERPKR